MPRISKKALVAAQPEARASVASTAFLFARGETLLADTIRTAGATDAARDQFIVGYLAAQPRPSSRRLTRRQRRRTAARKRKNVPMPTRAWRGLGSSSSTK